MSRLGGDMGKRFNKKIVSQSISSNETIDLESFLKGCKGLFITDCIKELRKCKIKNPIITSIHDQLHEDGIEESFHNYKFINYYPIPHMLDSDWRFTYETQKKIIEKINAMIDINDRCLFVGTPSIIHNKDSLLNKDLDITLLEKNVTSVNFKNKMIIDVLDFNPKNKFDIILSDPPWYKKAYFNFIKKFSDVINQGGILLLVFPSEGVRPSVKKEKKEIIKFSNRLGFKLIENLEHQINYYSPPFEVRSIIDNSISNFPLAWRLGDLLILKKEKSANNKFKYVKPRRKTEWEEVCVEKIRFMVLKSKVKKSKPILEKIYKSDVLPTVSMRNKRIKKIGLWTSGNRVYKCNDSKKMIEILNYRRKTSFEECKKRFNNYKEIVNLIESIIKTENDEYGKYWD